MPCGGWLLALRWSWPVRVRAYACAAGECGRCACGVCARQACVRRACVRVRGWGVRQACVRRVCATGATGAGVARTEKANFS